MRKTLLPVLFFFISLNCFSQKDPVTEKPFEVVEVQAQFPGGQAGWIKYLRDSLNSSLAELYLNPKPGQTIKQTAVVSFMVDKEGKVSEVKIENPEGVHPALAMEAMRVIRRGPNWIPAVQNGNKVTFRHRQSITWAATGEE